jgi:hypothetical protein
LWLVAVQVMYSSFSLVVALLWGVLAPELPHSVGRLPEWVLGKGYHATDDIPWATSYLAIVLVGVLSALQVCGMGGRY